MVRRWTNTHTQTLLFQSLEFSSFLFVEVIAKLRNTDQVLTLVPINYHASQWANHRRPPAVRFLEFHFNIMLMYYVWISCLVFSMRYTAGLLKHGGGRRRRQFLQSWCVKYCISTNVKWTQSMSMCVSASPAFVCVRQHKHAVHPVLYTQPLLLFTY